MKAFDPTVSVPLAVLPSSVVFPEDLERKISYDTIALEVRYIGVMTEAERNQLLDLSVDSAYQAAIHELYAASNDAALVPLAVLPATVVFTEDLKHKISYDTIVQELRYIGVMTEAERDELIDLSVDSAYQAAIDELYEASNDSLDPGDDNVFLTPIDAAALFDEPEDDNPVMDVPERFSYVLKQVVPYLRKTLNSSLVKQMLSDALNLDTAITNQLLTQRVCSTKDASQKAIEDFLNETFAKSQSKLTAAEFPEQFLTFERLHKIATIIIKLKISADELAWIFEHSSGQGWLNLAELPVQPSEPDALFTEWSKLIDALQVRDQLPPSETTLFDLFDLIYSFEAIDANAKKTFLTELSESTGWDLTDIEVLVGQNDVLSDNGLLEMNFPDHFQTEEALLVLIPCFKHIKRLGVSAQELKDWVKPQLSFEDARSIKQAVKAKYDNTQWLEVAKPLRDVLREKQRASLVAYLIHHADRWLSDNQIEALRTAGQCPDANKLYAHFLLDVEMSPCMMTSRIKQASGSVQLFIQRCLMGLEEDVSLTKENAQQWKWMKNYRVWEANRKIFLYPENWIEPELRDDKTPFFNDLENELMQNEVNQDTAESAFLNYLEKLDAVARLNIRGMYHQQEISLAAKFDLEELPTSDDESDVTKFEVKVDQNILHVFGRTEGTPPTYYYRRGVDYSYWTAWEEVNVDIEGDHLIPVVHEGRLKLFWPIFTEKQEEQYDPDSDLGKKYWEIQLAWSEYKDGKWTAKKISAEEEKLISKKFKADDFGTLGSKENYFFKALQWGHNLAILCIRMNEIYREGTDPSKPYVGVFTFTGCRGSILTQGMLHLLDSEARKKGLFVKQIPTPLINYNTNPRYEFIATLHHRLSPSPDRSQIQNMAFVEEVLDLEALFPGEEEVDWEEIDDSLNLTPDYYPLTKIPTLNKTPGTFELLYQHQLREYQLKLLEWVDQNRSMVNVLYFLLRHPSFQFLRNPSFFFYQDDFRTFFVIPVPWQEEVQVFEKDKASPEYLEKSSRNYGLEALPISLSDTDLLTGNNGTAQQTALRSHTDLKDLRISQYLFKTFYHPYLCRFIKALNRHGVDGLLQRDIQLLSHDFFVEEYEPTEAVVPLYPRDDVDFNFDGAYSQYNWELFFHAPLLIAERLSNNQRFAEAQQWYHYIFDPTDSSDDEVPKRYWRTRPFYEATDEKYQNEQIRNLLQTLADKSKDPGLRTRLENQVNQWRRNPFKPHLIARMRTTAYQKSVVMKYVSNLIAWGDYLFRQDSIESINEATQLYILAAEILGPRPQKVPARSKPATKAVNDLVLNPDLDAFSNLLEDALPPSYSASSVADTDGLEPFSLGSVLYFCIPKNDKLLEYWDTVEDRLFKIRHCMNIEGVVRELPLFQPPIEPGLLVKAIAAGIDISSVLNDMNAPLPHYRCQVMLQKALELCNDVKAIGGSLLSALEKRDAEALALLRSTHEIDLLNNVRVVKEKQVDEAEETLKNIKKSRDLVRIRKTYYSGLLTNSPTLSVSVDTGSSEKSISITPLYPVNEFELAQLGLTGGSLIAQAGQAAMGVAAAILHLIPNVEAGAPTTMGITYGGANIASALQAFGGSLGVVASMLNTGASLSATMGSYKRRAEEWDFQKRLATKELEQFELADGQDGPQILAAKVRIAISEKDLDNHDLQIENASEVDIYMRDKFTNQELYSWMVSQTSTVYFQTYQLAYDLAKRAEKTYRYELGLDDSNFIQFGYWDSLKKGLLAGERLHHDLKRLETAYLAQNKREYELTKSISLAMLDPVALIKLRETGECFFSIPEAVFDLDHPGHYFRRIKTISLTIPCVTGPYASVSATLTMQSNRIRKKTSTSSQYAWSGEFNDSRFNYNLGGIQSIATSSGQNDSGLFELNFRDERYLPFEGSGVISTWRLQLPNDFRQFDYDTISDIVIHMRYTAREGGELLKQEATKEIGRIFEEASAEVPLIHAFSAKHDFPSEWHHFLHPNADEDHHSLNLALNQERFPFHFRDKTVEINSMCLFLKLKDDFEYDDDDPLSLTLLTLKNPLEERPYEGSDPEFTVSGSLIKNVPSVMVFQEKNQSPGAWLMEIPGANIDTHDEPEPTIGDDDTETRKDIPDLLRLHPENTKILDPDAIEDLIIVCYYSVSSS